MNGLGSRIGLGALVLVVGTILFSRPALEILFWLAPMVVVLYLVWRFIVGPLIPPPH